MTKKILIIAEAGINHNGSIPLAKQLIDLAFEAGAESFVQLTRLPKHRSLLKGDIGSL